jgi:hypothetical protein
MKTSSTPEQLKPFFQGLRKYQVDAIDHLLQNFAAGRRRLLIAHPTGSGKNHIITRPSVITSNPAICDHFKSGQRSRTQDMKLFYLTGAGSGKFCFVSL